MEIGFQVLFGLIDPFDPSSMPDGSPKRRPAVLLDRHVFKDGDEQTYLLLLPITSHKGETPAHRPGCLPLTGAACEESGLHKESLLNSYCLAVPEGSFWVQSAKSRGMLYPMRDKLFGQGFSQHTANLPVQVVSKKSPPPYFVWGHGVAPAQEMVYSVKPRLSGLY